MITKKKKRKKGKKETSSKDVFKLSYRRFLIKSQFIDTTETYTPRHERKGRTVRGRGREKVLPTAASRHLPTPPCALRSSGNMMRVCHPEPSECFFSGVEQMMAACATVEVGRVEDEPQSQDRTTSISDWELPSSRDTRAADIKCKQTNEQGVRTLTHTHVRTHMHTHTWPHTHRWAHIHISGMDKTARQRTINVAPVCLCTVLHTIW